MFLAKEIHRDVLVVQLTSSATGSATGDRWTLVVKRELTALNILGILHASIHRSASLSYLKYPEKTRTSSIDEMQAGCYP